MAMLLLGILPFLFYHFFQNQYMVSIQLEQRMARLTNTCYVTSQRLTDSLPISDSNIGLIQPELEQMARSYNGRVVLVDRSFRVVYDSYDMDERRYFMEERILRAFEGKSSAKVNKAQTDFEIVQPIVGKDGRIEAILVLVAATDDVMNAAEEVQSKSRLLLSILLLLVVELSYLAAWQLAKPLRKLLRSAEQFRDEQVDTIEADYAYEELDDVADIFQDIIRRLRAIDESRKEFVSNVSHELKTPITSIRVLADSLLQDPSSVPIELYQEFMQDISDELDRENKIINDLLALVRVDDTVNALNVTPVNMNEVLEHLLKNIRPIAQQRNIELVLESFRPVEAQVDEVKLVLALTNLVENAVKYNVENGWVHVSLNADHKFFYVKIADSGIGIPQEDQARIFERFYRVDKARSRETGGTGLGLAITKNIIQLHRGSIRVHSRENEGTTFVVRIPLNAGSQEGRWSEHEEA